MALKLLIMDKETVIEAIIELAKKGKYSWQAIDSLHEELKGSYSPDKITQMIEIAKLGHNERDKKAFAEFMYDLLCKKGSPNSIKCEIKAYLMKSLIMGE